MTIGMKRAAKAYALAQLTVGVETGVAIGVVVGALGWPVSTACAVILPLGLPLLAVHYISATRWFLAVDARAEHARAEHARAEQAAAT